MTRGTDFPADGWNLGMARQRRCRRHSSATEVRTDLSTSEALPKGIKYNHGIEP